MRKSVPVIVKPLTTLVVIALAATLPVRPAAAAQTNPTVATQSATPGTILPESIPATESFNAIDLPSDDGSSILVKWAKPANEPKGISYVIQVARSKADFQAGKFVTKEVFPSPIILGTTKPEYFGRGKNASQTCFAVISPAELFPPAKPGPLTEARLKELKTKKVLTDKELGRALAVLAEIEQEKSQTKPASVPATAQAGVTKSQTPKLTSKQRAERKWYARLGANIKKLDAEALTKERARINAEPSFFRLGVKLDDQTILVARDGEPIVVEAIAKPNLFKWGKLNNLTLSLIFMSAVITFIEIARRKPDIFIRKIAGLEAIDEAIGRATEMDRPVMFVHGGGSVGSMSVIASLNILSHVASRAAEHDTRIRVMNQDPLVTAVSQEAVQQACTEAGRPDAFNADDVSLVASDQFSYVAAVSGIMVREQPGAIFMLGAFGAESLLLSETGSSTGAIQVAGTDSYTQLPFFVTTCDYTLMGEELYAASAYLSREPRMLGSLRGQDVGKAFVMIVLLAGTAILTVAAAMDGPWQWLRGLLEATG